jgi:GAF domain-containing protein
MNIGRRLVQLSVRAKIAIFALAALALTAALAYYAGSAYLRDLQPISGALAQSLVRERAEVLSLAINTFAIDLERIDRITSRYSLYTVVTSDDESAARAARNTLRTILRSLLRDNRTFRSLRFVAADGQVIISEPPLPDVDDTSQPYFALLSATSGPQPLYVGQIVERPAAALDLVTTLDDGTARVGYLVATIDVTSPLGQAEFSYFDALGAVDFEAGSVLFYLARPDGTLEALTEQPITLSAATLQTLTEMFSRNDQVPTEYVSPLLGRPVLGAARWVPALERYLVAEAVTAQFGAAADRSGQFLVQLGLLTATMLIVLALLWSYLGFSVVGPLREAARSAQRAAKGSLAQRGNAPLNSDEIGVIRESMSALTSLIRQDIRDLETRVAQRTRDLEATREIGQITSSIRELDTLLSQVVELICQRFDTIYHAQVFLIDNARQYAVLRASTGQAGIVLLARGHRLAVGSQSVIGQTTSSGQPVVTLDTATSIVHRANELLPDTRAELALPLRTREGVIGALDLQSKQPEAFTNADIDLFQSVADQLAIAIANARLFEELQTRLNEIEDLNRRMIGEAWRGYEISRRRALPTRQRTAQHSDEWSPLQRHAVQTRDVQEQFDGETVTFAVPVILRDQVFGAIEWVVPRATYSENTRLLARELAARLAVTADNTRLLEQSQRLADRERLVNEITATLTSQTSVEDILRLAVRELGQALRVPQTSIRLATGAGPEEEEAASPVSSLDPEAEETR